MCPRNGPQGRNGFAVPLAILIVVALALLTALMLDTAVAEFRGGDAWLSAARAVAAAETAAANGLGARLDSAALQMPAGTVVLSITEPESGSALVTVQILAPGLARLTVFASTGTGRLRAIAGRQVFVRIVAAADVPGELVLTPLPGPGWAAIP